jgi:hypothetical protein
MAHFARIEDGIVREVIVVNNIELDDNGTESESKGIAFCRSLLGADTDWVQTSYNGNPIGGVDRGPYAGIGFTWDGERFAAPASEQVE